MTKKRNSLTKDEMKKMSEKYKGDEKKDPKIVVPYGVCPMNNRIYTVEIDTAISKSKDGSLAIVRSQQDISQKTYFVAVADPGIKYKFIKKQKGMDVDKVVERELKAGDIVRPFVLLDANHYRSITDTIGGVTYTIFEKTEIASVIPAEEAGIIIENIEK